MASKRLAAGTFFVFSVLSVAYSCPAVSRPILPPDPPSIEATDLKPALDAPRLDVVAPTSAAKPAEAAAERSLFATRPGRVLADFAMKLRNIAYRKGGREPTTGFDCSGFVRYVYQHTLGLDLPSDSASQFQAGTRVDRDALKMGDLVFFRVHGKRVSHVGIYLDNGLFIHAPSSGKRVRIDRLDESYWAKRYVGAKRQEGLAANAAKLVASTSS